MKHKASVEMTDISRAWSQKGISGF